MATLTVEENRTKHRRDLQRAADACLDLAQRLEVAARSLRTAAQRYRRGELLTADSVDRWGWTESTLRMGGAIDRAVTEVIAKLRGTAEI